MEEPKENHTIHPALERAQKLLDEDISQIKHRVRVRWWNIAVVCLVLLGLISIVTPFAYPETKDGLWGNLLAEIWGILATSVIAWIVFKRFQVERFDRETSHLFDSVRSLRELALEIYPEIIHHLDTPSFDALSTERRQRLHELADLAFLRFSLFSRYLEIEDLSTIDKCATSAYELSVERFSKSPEQNMCILFAYVSRIYFTSSLLLEVSPNDTIVKDLRRARKHWIDCLD